MAAEARLILMVGISWESRQGRDQRAREVRVCVDGNGEMAGLFDPPEMRRATAPAA